VNGGIWGLQIGVKNPAPVADSLLQIENLGS
jgi:hypothetical protein